MRSSNNNLYFSNLYVHLLFSILGSALRHIWACSPVCGILVLLGLVYNSDFDRFSIMQLVDSESTFIQKQLCVFCALLEAKANGYSNL